jgi:hypothetical protein
LWELEGGVEVKKNSSMKQPLRNENVLRFPNNKFEEDKEKLIVEQEILNGPVPNEEFTPPPWIFQHQDLKNVLESAEVIDEKSLKNKLNHVHFTDKNLLILLRHPKYDDNVIVKVQSGPCLGNELICQFLSDGPSRKNLKNFKFLYLIIDDGQSVILISATLNKMGKHSLSLTLPGKAYAVGKRQMRRYACEKIDVELVQRGLVIKGALLDYSPEGFCIRVDCTPNNNFDWSLCLGDSIMVHLRKDHQHFFSGLCHCIRQQEGFNFVDVVMVPGESQVHDFASEEARKSVPNVSLTPVIIFDHPFFGKRIQLDVSDISTSGFSVHEVKDDAVLMQGVIIPEVTIEFAGAITMECSAQVIGRFETDESKIRCDFAILDMGINSYTRLVHILANSIDPYSRISNKVDMDALWEFFFETGFIYPKKYDLIQSQKEKFKQTYRDLYNDNPEIARHFVYQRNGRLFAHISMVRAYECAWLIQHHAARSVEGRRAGFAVLKQIVLYLNDMHRLPSTKIDQMMVYFQPENKFPDRVFGGFARSKENTGVCSMDLFCYLPYSGPSISSELPEGWSVSECSAMNLWELNLFYRNRSGGLFMDALGLAQKNRSEKPLEEAYSRIGFLRKWRAYSLEFMGELEAVLIVNRSDFGFNLSELLNGIKVLLINPEHLSWNILSTVIGQLLSEYPMEEIPIMFFPLEQVEAMDIPFEKQYQLWIYDARFVDKFVQYMKRKFRIKDW